MRVAKPVVVEVPPAQPSQQATVRVLLVDDQAMIGEALRRQFVGEPGIEFHYCSSADEALPTAKRFMPTVILQDLVMPGTSGLELVRRYRADPKTSRIPIIVLSTREEPAVKRDAFAAGANDYVVKLPDRIELIARVRYHSLGYLGQLQRDEAYAAFRQSQQKLVESNLELQRLTHVDGLTGLSNRRYFDEYMGAEWKRAVRSQTPLSIAMIDVDHFKLYNDTYGHLAGDEALKRVSMAIMESCKRSTDLAARYGGEEFVVIFPATPANDLRAIAEAVRASVEALAIPHRASKVGPFVTISMGVASAVPQQSQSSATLIESADKALYAAKFTGRNRVVSDIS
jgi:two-component system chemotaxis family response regulator WspR